MTNFKTPENIQKLFNTIADKYDFMNNLISFGMHKSVKKKCIENLDIKPHTRILDACTGTGDIAYFIRQKEPYASVTGIDFSENMLKIACKRQPDMDLRKGDVTHLEFEDNTFDIVTMGFGLRNITNPEKALSEIHRVLKAGGYFMHLDFGKKNILNKFFDITVPLVARIFYGNAVPYGYLISSKQDFPEPHELIKDFEKSGFKFVKRKDYVMGALSVQIMKK